MIDFEKVYEKETGCKTRTAVCVDEDVFQVHTYAFTQWLEERLAESTETLITEYHNICNNCGHSKCPTAGNPTGKCGEMMKSVIERNTGESIEKVLEARK